MKKHKSSKSNIDSSDEDTKEIKTVTCMSENLEDIDDKCLPKVVIEPKLMIKGKQSQNIMMNFKKFQKCYSQTNSQDSPSVKLVVYNQRFEEETQVRNKINSLIIFICSLLINVVYIDIGLIKLIYFIFYREMIFHLKLMMTILMKKLTSKYLLNY